jgi:hypothetical protein
VALADKQNAKVSAFVQQFLEPGERELAVVGQASKGPNIWLLGLISAVLIFLQKYYGVVVTDRRVFLVRLKLSLMSASPKEIEAQCPVADAYAAYDRGPITGRLHLNIPGREELSLQCAKIYQDGGERVAAAVRSASEASAAGPG